MQIRSSLTGAVVGLLTLSAAAAGQDAAARVAPKESAREAPQAAKVGDSAPDFTLLDATGTKHTLSQYKDKVVVLEWVNQECPWSVKAVPVVNDLHKKYRDKGVVWLGIESTHWRKPEENVRYAKDKEIAYPILMDNDGTVGRLYGAKTTPHLYVINKGKLVYAGALHNNQHGDKKDADVRNYVEEALTAVLAGKDVPLPETRPWGCSVKYKESKSPPAPETPRDQPEDGRSKGAPQNDQN